MKYILSVFLLVCIDCYSATYFVDTTNAAASDVNPGTALLPWKTISHATTNISAGDTVNIEPGTYNEFVHHWVSGTTGSPVTWTGVRGSGGEWLTIIDPSTPYTNGWVAAPEVGTGVYKQTGMPFVARVVSLNNSNVPGVFTNGDVSQWIPRVFTNNTGITMGTQCLAVASAQQYQSGDGVSVSYWNPLGALFCADTNTCYLRLRDGSNPNGLSIRIAPNYDPISTWQPINTSAGVWFPVCSNIVWQNTMVRNCFTEFYIDNSPHITIQSNCTYGGYIRVYGRRTNANGNVVHGNTFIGASIGIEGGAWQGSTLSGYEDKQTTYRWSKYMMGTDNVFDNPIWFNETAGDSNIISCNIVSSGFGGDGIQLSGDVTRPMVGTVISNNFVEKQASVGILVLQGQTQTKIYGNTVSDCNGQYRTQEWNAVGETNRFEYYYRNISWLPDTVGVHVFVYFEPSGGTYHPTCWIYNNSFSGGEYGIQWNADAYANGGTPNMRIANNIISGTTAYINAFPSTFYTDPTMVGAFDYDLISPTNATLVSWVNPHVIRTNRVWTIGQGLNLALPTGSPAIDSALDVYSGNFTLNSVSYPALPNTIIIKTGASWDMGALEYQNPQTNSIAKVTNFHVKKTKVGP